MHRYGLLVIKSKYGRYYWSHPLEIVSFVPKGRQLSVDTLPAKTILEAVRVSLKREEIELKLPSV